MDLSLSGTGGEGILSLPALDAAAPKRLCVIGDPILDEWLLGEPRGCQDGCAAFAVRSTRTTAGGAAGAARHLEHWRCEVTLIAPVCAPLERALTGSGVDCDLCFPCPQNPVKSRCVTADGRVHHRQDREPGWHGLSQGEM